MRSRRREDQDEAQEKAERQRLSARVAELEQRMMLLEARLRRMLAEQKARRGSPPARPVRAQRPRPRCPGCLLELPKGTHRAETCVWCGFVFAAVRATRSGATKAR